MIKRFEQIREHFEREAAEFDTLFHKIMPCYEEMMQALTESLPFFRNRRLDIADLGCGTGNLTLKVISAFPRARLTCVDMAENMLILAKMKLKHRRVRFRLGDIRQFDYAGSDAIVSSMVMHHIDRKDKPAFYRALFCALKPGGVFRNIDIFLGPDSHLQSLFTDRWKRSMRSSGLTPARINGMIRRHRREDRPVSLMDELEIMRGAGFRGVDVIKRDYGFAVYGGTKR